MSKVKSECDLLYSSINYKMKQTVILVIMVASGGLSSKDHLIQSSKSCTAAVALYNLTQLLKPLVQSNKHVSKKAAETLTSVHRY